MYKEAIGVYEDVLSEYPCSRWRFMSRFSHAPLRSRQQNPDVADNAQRHPDPAGGACGRVAEVPPRVYACNPMFTIDARSSTRSETFQAARRHSIRTLFKRERDSPGTG